MSPGAEGFPKFQGPHTANKTTGDTFAPPPPELVFGLSSLWHQSVHGATTFSSAFKEVLWDCQGGPRQFENPSSFFDVFGGYTHFLSHSHQRIWLFDGATSVKSALREDVFFFSPTPRQRIKQSP